MQRFPEPIDHIYFLCDLDKEPDRANYLQTWLSKQAIDPSQYTILMDCYGTDPYFQTRDVWRHYNSWSRGMRQNFNTTNLKPAELSLVWNFAGVARRAVRAGHKVVAIFESDVLFCDNFLSRCQEAMQSLPPRWDFLSLSASAGLTPASPTQGRLWYPPQMPQWPTRCTDSMIFRVPVLQQILTTLFPCAEVLDWELNYQLTTHGATSLWLHPPITRQGSGVNASDTYKTTI
jgi:hypothetical protein